MSETLDNFDDSSNKPASHFLREPDPPVFEHQRVPRSQQILNEIFAKNSPPNSAPTALAELFDKRPLWLVPAAVIVIMLGLAVGYMTWPGQQQLTGHTISNSNNATIVGSAQTVNINNSTTIKQWNDLSFDEREQIKKEAIEKFPEIEQIGKGVQWKPVAKWLAEEKGVIHSNPRDLFRDRDKEGK